MRTRTENRIGFFEVFGDLKTKKSKNTNPKRNTSNQNSPMKADGKNDITFGLKCGIKRGNVLLKVDF